MIDQPNSIKFFYKNPSFINYIKIRRFIDPKIKKNKNKLYYTLFLYVIHMKYPSYEEEYIPTRFKWSCCFTRLNYLHDVDCGELYRHIMGNPALLTMTDIDLLWLSFYATGDIIYPDQVKARASAKKQSLISDAMTKTAAEWSYNNHVTEKFIVGPILSNNTSTTTLAVTDPLFFYPNDKTQADIMEKYKDE
jgi:hypothetical protein